MLQRRGTVYSESIWQIWSVVSVSTEGEQGRSPVLHTEVTWCREITGHRALYWQGRLISCGQTPRMPTCQGQLCSRLEILRVLWSTSPRWAHCSFSSCLCPTWIKYEWVVGLWKKMGAFHLLSSGLSFNSQYNIYGLCSIFHQFTINFSFEKYSFKFQTAKGTFCSFWW